MPSPPSSRPSTSGSQALGYRLEVDAEKTALLGIRAPLDPRFHYFDDYYTNSNGRYVVDFLQDINAAYPDLTELFDIGDAWLGQARRASTTATSGCCASPTRIRPTAPSRTSRPSSSLATIHAREVATPELAIRYIKYLTEGYDGEGGYGVDPDATWLVNHNVLYVLVMQNPDGHWVNEQDIGAYRRKNMDNDDGCNDPGSLGRGPEPQPQLFLGLLRRLQRQPLRTRPIAARAPAPSRRPRPSRASLPR